MTENQKIWWKEHIEEHRVAAANESIWALGAPDEETAKMHETNAAEHREMAELMESVLEAEV